MKCATLSASGMSRMHNFDVECQCLEEWNSVLASHFLEDNCEFVIGDLVDEVSLELNDDMVTSKHGTERVTLIAKEAEAVAFQDQRIIKACLNRSLCTHNCKVKHVFQALVADFDCEGEGLGCGVDGGWSDLFELYLGLQFLNSLLNDWVMLVHDINDKLWCIESERVSQWIVSAQFR